MSRSCALCDESPHHSAALGDGFRGRGFKCHLAGACARGLRAGSVGAGPVWAGRGARCQAPRLLVGLTGLAAGLPEQGCRGLEREHPSQSPGTRPCPGSAVLSPCHPATLCHSSEKRAGLPGRHPRRQSPGGLVAASWAWSPGASPAPSSLGHPPPAPAPRRVPQPSRQRSVLPACHAPPSVQAETCGDPPPPGD